MGKGWGYGKGSMSLSDKIKNGKTLKSKTENLIIYEYVYNNVFTGFKDVLIKYIDNKRAKTKIIILSGLYENMQYTVTDLKNQDAIFDYVANILINEYMIYNTNLEDEYFNKKENDFKEVLKNSENRRMLREQTNTK